MDGDAQGENFYHQGQGGQGGGYQNQGGGQGNQGGGYGNQQQRRSYANQAPQQNAGPNEDMGSPFPSEMDDVPF